MNHFLDRHKNYLKYLLLLSFITFVILFAARAAHGAWYNASWQYRKKITIQSSQVIGGPHSDFPVLVKLATDAELAANARNDGYDILFTSSDETTKIAHEREKFDGGTGELVAWVKVGSVSSSGNTDIYMYYGNLSATDQQLVVPTKSDVWSDYVGVWHLHDDLLDSTSNDNDGTAFGSIDATGKIADGQQYDGIDDYDNYGNKSNLNVNYITVSFWLKVNSWVSDGGVLSKGTASTRQYWIWTYGGTVAFEVDEGGNHNGAWNPPSGEWQHFALTYDGSNAITYRNGGLETNTYPQTTGTILTTTEPLLFGDIPPYNHGDVNLDEVRISGSARSAQWIQTEYNNQAWPNTADTPSPLPNPNPGDGFITVDTQTSGGGGNSPPIVDAGTNQTISLPASAALSDASASDSDGPSSLTYTWIKQSGPGTVTFAPGDDELNPTASFSVDGTYVLKLSVYDGADTTEDTVTITVNAAGSVDVSGYSCNMKITIDNTKVAFTSENFPVLISITDDSLKTSGCGFVTDPDGDDIVFTNSNLTLQLYHEIEKYDEATGEIVAWVLVPALSGSTDTDIYMYFGDSNVSSPTESPTDVWDSNYSMVYHLNEPSGTSGSDSVTDSTGNTGGTPSAGISFGQTGRVGNSVDFSSGTGISLGSIGSSLLAADATVSFWMYSNNVASPSRQNPFDQAYGGWGTMTLETNGVINWFFGSDGGNASPYGSHGSGSGLVTNGSWIYVVGVRNSSGYTYNWYKNGAYVTGSTYSSTYPVINTRTFTIGDGYVNPINGRIDEFRISNTPRSAEWIQTSYTNQNSPASFYSIQKNCPSNIPPIAEFSCSVPITIDHTKVSGTSNLVNFPVLISLTDTGLKSAASCGYVEYSNGYDIIFSDATQTTVLDHEIEKYDSGSGELVAWVSVPTLKYNEDTVINIHFGHIGVCGATENPSGVWDSNYTAVWHLKETSGGADAIKDSTARANHGTDFNSPTFGVTGKIGNAVDFDGTADYATMPTSGFNTSAGTVELWTNIDTFPSADNKYMFSHFTPSPVANRVYVNLKPDNTWGTGMGDTYDLVRGSVVSAGTWYHLVLTWDGTNVRGYKDGALNFGPTSYSGLTTVGNIYVSAWDNTAEWFDGTLDEVRVSETVRSADWIQTEYNNQSDPSSFYSVGASSCFVLSGFSCNRRITIDSNKVEGSSDLTNFPFLIRIQNDCNIKSAANGGVVQNSSGWDIIFTDSDGVTQLDHEIEEYDGTTGDLTAWVKVPNLPYNSDKDIYMYYGKSGLACDPSNPTGVWDSSYEAVYHLNDDFEDSTSHNRDATAEDTDTYGAVIEDGEDFGPQDEISIGNWNFSGDELTLQAWARFDDFDQNDPRVFSKANGTSEQNHIFMLGLGGNLEQHLRMRIKTGTDDLSGTTTIVDTDDPLSSGNWYLIAGTYDGSNMRLLSNGLEVHSAAKTGNMRVNSWDIALGNTPGGTNSTTYSLDGKLDEVRILSVARSADWLKTEYNNQSDPDSFYSMSQDTCGGTFGFNFQYCKKITVDYTQVDSDLTDFPLLINITNDDDLKTVANGGRVQHSQGWDIVFRTSGCGNLDHEIEKYDGDNGDLVAWVRVPTLSSSTDTEIYMYYGANVICSTENPTAVWDSNYAAVWHLKEDPSGTAPQALDSTANDNDGTSNGSMTTADLVSGKIGEGIDFDGSNDWIESPNSGSLDITGNAITLSAWVKSTVDQNDDAGIINKSYSADYNYMLNVQSSDQGNFRVRTGGTSTYLTGSTALTAGQWYFLYGIYDGANAKVYLNGSEDGTDIRTGNIESSGAAPVALGRRRVYPTVDDRFFTGVIDEVHISNVARSTDWMITEFRNQNDPGNFYTVTSCFEQTTEVTQEWVEEVQ